MRPRIALVCVLALGVFLSGTGATLALSSGRVSAAQVVYQPTSPNSPQVLAQNPSSGTQPQSQTLPSTTSTPTVQPSKQVAAAPSQTLPFTGLAAIPILVIGVGMILVGLVVARRTRRRNDAA